MLKVLIWPILNSFFLFEKTKNDSYLLLPLEILLLLPLIVFKAVTLVNLVVFNFKKTKKIMLKP